MGNGPTFPRFLFSTDGDANDITLWRENQLFPIFEDLQIVGLGFLALSLSSLFGRISERDYLVLRSRGGGSFI